MYTEPTQAYYDKKRYQNNRSAMNILKKKIVIAEPESHATVDTSELNMLRNLTDEQMLARKQRKVMEAERPIQLNQHQNSNSIKRALMEDRGVGAAKPKMSNRGADHDGFAFVAALQKNRSSNMILGREAGVPSTEQKPAKGGRAHP